MIVACGPVRVVAGGGLVYAVAVSQPVQSWTVLRSHEDFRAVADALSAILSGLPACPLATDLGENPAQASVVKARNELQHWLSAILMYPGARESPAVRNFLTYGANTIPPQYEGVAWTQFSTVLSPVQALDDMQMDDMFEDNNDDGAPSQEDHYDYDEDVPAAASIRYKPTDEAVTDQDEMDLMAGEVEMIDDIGIGSLAQSMGASHLGRSLQLQAQLKHMGPPGTGALVAKVAPVQGLNVGGAGTQQQLGKQSSGGLGSAMEEAKSSGLATDSTSFNHTPLQSAPRLDSFKMIKVIGKGSFGTL